MLLQHPPDIGSALPNNVNKNRNFAESGVNTPEAQADVIPDGGKIRTPRQKVLALDLRVTYVYPGDDYYKKKVKGLDADTSWCINDKNGASWLPDYDLCLCAGKGDCEVTANSDGVTKEKDCSTTKYSDYFVKASCQGHCSCKSKSPNADAAQAVFESCIKDMHKAFGDHIQFKLGRFLKLDISNKTGTPPTDAAIKTQILDTGVFADSLKALEWIMKQVKDINTDITKAPYRNPNIEILVVPKTPGVNGRAWGEHMHMHGHKLYPPPEGVATILTNSKWVQNKGFRQTLYHEVGHILGLRHTFDGI